MPSAQLDDRGSLAAAYPREQFERDAARNAEVKRETLSGVVLLSAPDAAGWFEIDQASRHVGEVAPSGDTAFLYPTLGDAEGSLAGARSGYANEEAGLGSGRSADYDAFLDRVVATVRGLRARQSPGRDDPRLKGARQ
jgi:hypothetical protein